MALDNKSVALAAVVVLVFASSLFNLAEGSVSVPHFLLAFFVSKS
jgi:hypothetical protein